MKQTIDFQSTVSVSHTTALRFAFLHHLYFALCVGWLVALPAIALHRIMVKASKFCPYCLFPYLCNSNLAYLTVYPRKFMYVKPNLWICVMFQSRA